MASFKIQGLEDFEKQLKKLQKNAKELGKQKTVPLGQLFPEQFMRKYTAFATISDFFESGGFRIETQEDLDAIPEDSLNLHVSTSTKFKNWKEMGEEALSQYLANQLGF